MRDRLLVGLVRTLSRLPLPVLYAMAEALLWVLYDLARYRRDLVRSNLRRTLPELSECTRRRVARHSYRNALQTLVETIKALRIDKSALLRRVTIENPEAVLAPIRAGVPVVAAAAHQANWEWFQLAVAAQLDCPAVALYKHLNHPAFDDLMLGLRARFGTRLFAQDELLGLLRERRRPRLVGMVADLAPRPHDDKHWTRFFDIDTAFYKGPELLARRLECPLLFARMRRVGRGRYRIRFESLADTPADLPPGALMDRYAAAVEREIRAAPQDWLWLYKRWKYPRGSTDATRESGD